MDESSSEVEVRNSVWTAPARADRMLTVFKKTHPGTTFLKDFAVILGAKARHLGHFGLPMALFFGAGCRVTVGVMEIVGMQPQGRSGQRAKSTYPARHMIRSSIFIDTSVYVYIYET